ncbi:uncharacterized [Tachysurus ichikawai]
MNGGRAAGSEEEQQVQRKSSRFRGRAAGSEEGQQVQVIHQQSTEPCIYSLQSSLVSAWEGQRGSEGDRGGQRGNIPVCRVSLLEPMNFT